jgi:hypothetical protein
MIKGQSIDVRTTILLFIPANSAPQRFMREYVHKIESLKLSISYLRASSTNAFRGVFSSGAIFTPPTHLFS